MKHALKEIGSGLWFGARVGLAAPFYVVSVLCEIVGAVSEWAIHCLGFCTCGEPED